MCAHCARVPVENRVTSWFNVRNFSLFLLGQSPILVTSTCGQFTAGCGKQASKHVGKQICIALHFDNMNVFINLALKTVKTDGQIRQIVRQRVL